MTSFLTGRKWEMPFVTENIGAADQSAIFDEITAKGNYQESPTFKCFQNNKDVNTVANECL